MESKEQEEGVDLCPFLHFLLLSSAYLFVTFYSFFLHLCSSLPVAFYWTQFISWMLYANEAMTIAQWSGVQNISKCGL